ncbi:hypothetical protein GGQ85_003670 [Nitrobacter vulgaris]|uniref:hypothetical protein n=1 Tax=Nitrobacter vulgaris TaxID=29421 RepID=UPI002858CA4B|nr:hypothetical protein [Nitrobacter vulgaris]MDR6305943.1 hypothetical protein [Nitrobacter vulgaris]
MHENTEKSKIEVNVSRFRRAIDFTDEFTSGERAIAGVIADHFNKEEGYSFPTYKYLEHVYGFSSSMVAKTIDKIKRDWMTVDGSKRNNSYRLNMLKAESVLKELKKAREEWKSRDKDEVGDDSTVSESAPRRAARSNRAQRRVRESDTECGSNRQGGVAEDDKGTSQEEVGAAQEEVGTSQEAVSELLRKKPNVQPNAQCNAQYDCPNIKESPNCRRGSAHNAESDAPSASSGIDEKAQPENSSKPVSKHGAYQSLERMLAAQPKETGDEEHPRGRGVDRGASVRFWNLVKDGVHWRRIEIAYDRHIRLQARQELYARSLCSFLRDMDEDIVSPDSYYYVAPEEGDSDEPVLPEVANNDNQRSQQKRAVGEEWYHYHEDPRF